MYSGAWQRWRRAGGAGAASTTSTAWSNAASRSGASGWPKVGCRRASAGWLRQSIGAPRRRAPRGRRPPALARRGSRGAARSSARRSRARRCAPGRGARRRRRRRGRAARSAPRPPRRARRVRRRARRPRRRMLALRALFQAACQLADAPRPDERGRLRPGGRLVCQCGDRGGGVEARDPVVATQLLRVRREATGLERGLERLVPAEDLGRLLRPDPRRAGQPVGRVAAERDEVRHLLRLDAVALAHLRRPDARELGDAAGWLEDRHLCACELERVAVGGGDEDGRLGVRCGRGEGVVRFVPGRLRVREPQRLDQYRQELELLQELLVEDPAGLGALEGLVPVGRHGERVPGDEDGARLLRVPEPEQHVREADDRARGATLGAADRLRQGVVGAVREGVAVDGEERPRRAHSVSWGRRISAISRSVVSWPSSVTSTRGPYATRSWPSRASRSLALIAAGTSGATARRAIRAAP